MVCTLSVRGERNMGALGMMNTEFTITIAAEERIQEVEELLHPHECRLILLAKIIFVHMS